MYRRTLIAAAAASKRTIVRDPRKAASAVTKTTNGESSSSLQEQPPPPPPPQMQQPQPPPPFAPSQANQESIGSSLASYALAGKCDDVSGGLFVFPAITRSRRHTTHEISKLHSTPMSGLHEKIIVFSFPDD